MVTTRKPNEITRAWYIVDAEGVVLGRLASEVATILQGKNREYYSPQWDMGDNVVVINAEKVVLTGNKERNKVYYRHSGYPGGIRGVTAQDMRKNKPERMIELAVKRMLPKSRLANVMIKKMHVYAGTEHSHAPQEPVELIIKG